MRQFFRKAMTLSALCLTLSSAAEAQNLFSGGYVDNEFALSISYVNKDWVTDFDGKSHHENFWGEPDKRLHGVNITFHYQPCFDFGLGLHTGLGFETYTSYSDVVKDNGWDQFNEYCIYIPLHLQWRIPLTPGFSLTPFAGLGIQASLYSSYRDYDYYYYDWNGDSHYYGPESYQSYGNGEWPKRMNLQVDYGCRLNIKRFMLGFQYSKGITDHDLYKGYKTAQNKIEVSAGFCFSAKDF